MLAGDGVGEAVVVEHPALGDDGPAAGQVVPEVGLVVAVGRGGDEDQERRQQGTRPVVGRPGETEGARHRVVTSGRRWGNRLFNYRSQTAPEVQAPVRGPRP